MQHLDTYDLKTLVANGKTQGYLTYDEVNAYLPDEDVKPEKLDNLLVALDEIGHRAGRQGARRSRASARAQGSVAAGRRSAVAAQAGRGLPKLSDDPIRMYLTQMAEIPLLTRRAGNLAGQEDRSHPQAVPPHACSAATTPCRPRSTRSSEVHEGELPFDRTIKVSLTERLTKEQIMARMPHNLRTLEHLLDAEPRGLHAS